MLKLNESFINQYNLPINNICPYCDVTIDPQIIYEEEFRHYNSKNMPNEEVYNEILLVIQCTSCKHFWTNEYNVSLTNHSGTLNVPARFVSIPDEVNDNLAEISPEGVKIYIQSLQAESQNYNKIVGIGLRKSLEFFIKDYLIHILPDNEKEIRKSWLSTVIKKFIDDENLKALALSTVYIGNDEAHYDQKYSDKDVQDLKRFLKAVLRYIDYKLTIQEAHDFVD